MRTFINEKSVEIKRQVYVGDKSSFSTVATGTGYLRNVTQDEVSANGFQFGRDFALLFEKGLDIKDGDLVTIDSVEYTVVGVSEFPSNVFSIPYGRAMLNKPQKS